MTDLMDLPAVSECSVSGCSYNHDHVCSAAAITVSGADQAQCVIFIPLNIKGGLDRVGSRVGACQRADCSHNSALTCVATSIRIGAGQDPADCLTYVKG